MVSIQIEIEDKSAIVDALKREPVRAASALNKAVAKVMFKIQGDAMKNAPVNKQSGGGNLRQSIRARMTANLSGIVEVGANYAVYVHEGTAPHTITVKNARGLANKRTGQFFGRKVNHPGTRANPFLQKAIDENKNFTAQTFNDAIKSIFK